MARKTETFTATDGRDAGKIFVLTEMAADAAEWWAVRALLALAQAGAELPDGASAGGMAGFAAAGLQALTKLPPETIKPLLEEMLTCVQYQPPNRQVSLQPIFRGAACQIDEVATFVKLRLAVFKLHTDFSGAGTASSTASSPLSPA